MPRISVIIPTHNRRDLVCRAIDSVIGQTFDDWELLVVDDGSTDGTADLPVFAENRPRVQLVVLDDNRGVSGARNRGVATSAGGMIAFLDSDDQWHPRKLERQVAWMDAHPEMRICQSREIWIRNGMRVNPPRTHEKMAGWIFEQSLHRCMITPSSVMMTRELFDTTGGFDESFPACEDYDLWLRITACNPVGLVDEALLTRFGGHPDQLSATVPMLDAYRIRAMEKILASGVLTQEQSSLTRAIVAEKARIVALGCRKREKLEEYAHYDALARRYADDHGADRTPAGC